MDGAYAYILISILRIMQPLYRECLLAEVDGLGSFAFIERLRTTRLEVTNARLRSYSPLLVRSRSFPPQFIVNIVLSYYPTSSTLREVLCSSQHEMCQVDDFARKREIRMPPSNLGTNENAISSKHFIPMP